MHELYILIKDYILFKEGVLLNLITLNNHITKKTENEGLKKDLEYFTQAYEKLLKEIYNKVGD